MGERSSSRRRYLLRIGAAGATALAGCSGGTGGDEDPASDGSGSASSPADSDDGSDGSTGANGSDGGDDSADGNRTDDDVREVNGNGSVWTFRYDVANTGHDPSGSGPESEPKNEWSVDLGDRVLSSPAVADGAVFVGSWDGRLYALEADSGGERWRTGAGASVTSSPAIVDGAVYVGDHDGAVYALEADGGDEAWRFETDGPVLSSPTVVDGTVFVGSHDGRVYAIDAEDGTESWQYDHERDGPENAVYSGGGATGTAARPAVATRPTDPAGGPRPRARQPESTGTSTPAVVDGTVYVMRGSSLLALDAADGRFEWEYPLESSPSSLDRRAVDGSPIAALRGEMGGSTLSVQASLAIPSSPAIGDGAVYVGQSPDIHAVDAGGPDRRWAPQAVTRTGDFVRLLGGGASSGRTRSSSQVRYGVASSPAVADGLVYAGGEGVHALVADSGERAWSRSLEAAVESSPAVVGGAVYVGAADGRLYAFDAADGTDRWAVDLGAPVRSSPAVVEGAVYVGTDGGTVHALSGP